MRRTWLKGPRQAASTQRPFWHRWLVSPLRIIQSLCATRLLHGKPSPKGGKEVEQPHSPPRWAVEDVTQEKGKEEQPAPRPATGGGRGGGQGGSAGTSPAAGERKRGAGGNNVESFIKNDKMHPKLEAVMKPMHERKIEIHLGQICKEAGITFESLPHTGPVKACYRWILGYCGSTEKCARKNTHCPGSDIPDPVAQEIADKIAPGIAKIVAKHDEAAAAKKVKTDA